MAKEKAKVVVAARSFTYERKPKGGALSRWADCVVGEELDVEELGEKQTAHFLATGWVQLPPKADVKTAAPQPADTAKGAADEAR